MAGVELPDIYAGQVAFASVRKQGRGSDVNVTGRRADGRPLTVSFEVQAAETDLPKLIWMKHRIESLLQAGKDREAIALAEKANLVCRGAAFIAWDDAEQVAIAEEEVYQPSLSTLKMSSKRVSSAPSSFLAENVRDYHRQAARARSFDQDLVGDIVDPDESGRLREQLKRTLETVLCASDARNSSTSRRTGQGTLTKSRSGRLCEHCCRNLSGSAIARIYAKCSWPFSSRFPIHGRQRREEYLRHGPPEARRCALSSRWLPQGRRAPA